MNPTRNPIHKAPAHILLIDVTGATMANLLRQHGYIVACPDYPQALSDLHSRSFDVIVVGTASGEVIHVQEVMDVLRLSDSPDYTAVCVFCTNLMGNNAQQIHGMGVDDVITSTCSPEEVLFRVQNLVRLTAVQTAQLMRAKELEYLSESLSEHKQKLVDAADARRDFISMMVHDLNSPLGAILANATFLKEYDLPRKDAVEIAEDIGGAAMRMRNLVLNILDISRAEQDQLKPELKPVSVHGLLETILGSLEMQELKIQHDVFINNTADGVSALADADLLSRVLVNLLDNARKYSPRGAPVAIRVHTPTPQRLAVSIADTGYGVSDANKERIFDVFTRTDASDTAVARVSRGIGLAFCKHAIQAQHGRIWVEDNNPAGSIFTFTLPTAQHSGQR